MGVTVREVASYRYILTDPGSNLASDCDLMKKKIFKSLHMKQSVYKPKLSMCGKCSFSVLPHYLMANDHG